MKTERLYYDYVSAAPLEAEITEVRLSEEGTAQLLLDRTIFYPEGGGQPSDRGTINGVPLLDVREKDGEILHLVSAGDAEKVKPGKAELLLDCRRRRDFTALHSGQHLLSGTLLRMIGAPTVSMHLGDESFTIDVNTAEIKEKTLVEIEEAVADAIEENHPVITHLCPPEDIASFHLRRVPPRDENVIRVVEIEGCDIIACCGTHVRTTAEIGLFRILGAEKYKGMSRVSFTAGHRLLLESRVLRQNAAVVSRALSVPVHETGRGILEFLEKTSRVEERLKSFEEKAIREKAALLCKAALSKDAAALPTSADFAKAAGSGSGEASGRAVIIQPYAEEDMNEVLNIGKIAQKQMKAVFVLASERDRKFAAFSSLDGFDLRPFIKSTFEAQGGKGGGGASFFQGGFESGEALGAFLSALRNTRV